MLYYNRIDGPERIDTKKTRVNLQPYSCNECHDVLMMSMNLSDIALLKIHGVDYRCTVIGISKNEVVSLLQEAHLNKTLKHYKI